MQLAVYEQCFSLSACGARQITEEWGELNINWHLEAFGAFYTPFWAAYGSGRFGKNIETSRGKFFGVFIYKESSSFSL